MPFKILRMVLGAGPKQIDISQDAFREIKKARDVISAALATEQKFDIVIENFFEFERELLELSLQHSFAMFRPWESFAHDRQRVNRRLGNLTFATRLFSDQVRRDAASLFGRNSAERTRLEEVLDEETKSLPHRTLLALRNRIQHQGFPEFQMTYQAGWEGDAEDPARRLHFWLDLRLRVAALEQGARPGDREFKALMEALRNLGEDIDLLNFVRQHIESIARVFEVFRDLLNPYLIDAETLVTETITRAKSEIGDDVVGLAAVTTDDDNSVVEEVQLFMEPMKYRRALRQKNQSFQSISKRFVSSVSRTLISETQRG
jgi:hypothetical protein